LNIAHFFIAHLYFYTMHIRPLFLIFSAVAVVFVALLAWFWQPAVWLFAVVLPLIGLGLQDYFQTKHAIRRNFPLLGRARYLAETLRPGVQQYFVENDLNGRPFSRIDRSLVYSRAKKETETTPFGTQMDFYAEGYEWMAHSMYPLSFEHLETVPRVTVGGADCSQPYSLALLNVSAMSYGSLSKNAIMALNGGAQIGGFAHNTGEGGVSPFHLQPGGDLIWQIGTGYFGCRADDGNFSMEKYIKTVASPNIKMVEIKLSQGAKPGHGGILPARKNTPEIAAIRGVKPGTDINSPPAHRAFSNATELCHFIKKLREGSNGKPVGFKLCVGSELEFLDICRAIVATGIKPDFITVDGGEGGTGAAPVEFSNSIGMPLRDGLSFVIDALVGFDLKKDIKIIASGHIVTGFDLAKAIALGADACNSARAMMLAVGCIQALQCHTNECPTGVATQDESLMQGLVVADKRERVANFQQKTVHAFLEMLCASGLSHPSQLERKHIYRRTSMSEVLRYDQLYPNIAKGSLLGQAEIPEAFRKTMLEG
jgi:glutamate synthase domain-containing protein 2